MATPANTNDLINTAAANNGVPVDWMNRILSVENPNLNPLAVSPKTPYGTGGVRGLSQITSDTWKTVNGPNVAYSTDPAAQLDTQAKLLAKYQNDYNGNFALAAAAYNGGPAVANTAQALMNSGVSQSDAIAQAAAQVNPGNTGRQNEITNYVRKASGQSAASLSASNKANSVAYLTDDSDPAVAVPVSGMTVSPAQLSGLLNAVTPTLVIDKGLDQAAWYNDSGILQVNNATAAVSDPVMFQIFFDLSRGALGSPGKAPVVISLNASLRSYQKSMRHVSNRQRTHTGMLVNLWGMQPDQISGQASTGMMANQLGVTDFLSLSTITDGLKDQVLQAFKSAGMEGSDIVEASMGTEGFFRVAAKDAFMELLSLFKNNGTVWFRNQNYTGYTTGLEQTAADAWSPATGSTTFQNAARRNDVMTRGKVVMYFRNSAYYGYFKNMTWVMDANNPYRWNFNFVYQVESTITNVGVPRV